MGNVWEYIPLGRDGGGGGGGGVRAHCRTPSCEACVASVSRRVFDFRPCDNFALPPILTLPKIDKSTRNACYAGYLLCDWCVGPKGGACLADNSAKQKYKQGPV